MSHRRLWHDHTHTYKLQKDQGHYSQQLHNSLLIEEAVEKLLLDEMRKNNRKWRDEVMGKWHGNKERCKWELVRKRRWENREGQRDRGLLKAGGCWRRQNGLRALCDAFGVALRSTWLSVSGSDDDGMFWKCLGTPAELIHSLWFTTAVLRRLNVSLFTLRGYAFPTWCNHTNQHFVL